MYCGSAKMESTCSVKKRKKKNISIAKSTVLLRQQQIIQTLKYPARDKISERYFCIKRKKIKPKRMVKLKTEGAPLGIRLLAATAGTTPMFKKKHPWLCKNYIFLSFHPPQLHFCRLHLLPLAADESSCWERRSVCSCFCAPILFYHPSIEAAACSSDFPIAPSPPTAREGGALEPSFASCFD